MDNLTSFKRRFEGKTVRLFDLNATMWANVRGGITESQNLLVNYGKKNKSPYRVKDFKAYLESSKRQAINGKCSISWGSSIETHENFVVWYEISKLTEEPEETEIFVHEIDQIS